MLRLVSFHPSPDLLFFLLYVIVGPLTWVMYGVLMHAGHRKMLLMRRPPHPLPAAAPKVSIIIPAKDEGARIRGCLQSALSQDYLNFEVVAIDDRSVDQTGAVMDEVAAVDARLHVIHKTQPPPLGWTGKNNALWVGQAGASGEWLLFVDSDVVLEKDALSVAMSVVLRKRFDMLSLLPRIESHSFWESVLIPLAGGAASFMYVIALTNNSKLSHSAFGNGQFLMISRAAYDGFGGHESVRDRFCEDIAIARILKSNGLRPRVSWGNEFAAVRMYSSLPAIFRGWSRIYYAARVGSPWRVLAALCYLIVCCFSAYAALGWGLFLTSHANIGYAAWHGPMWLIGSAVHLSVMTWHLAMVYEWSGNSRRYAFLFPIGGPMLMVIFLQALKMCITRRVEWRGTAYSHKMAVNPAETTAASQANAVKVG